MEIEQLPPKSPNFKLIVLLFVVTILLVLLGSYFFVRHAEMRTPDGTRATFLAFPAKPLHQGTNDALMVT